MNSLLARGPEQLESLAGSLADAFYLLAFVALLAALTGSPGLGLVFLLLAGGLHVARIGLEETARDRGKVAKPKGEDFRVYAARPRRSRARATAGTRH